LLLDTYSRSRRADSFKRVWRRRAIRRFPDAQARQAEIDAGSYTLNRVRRRSTRLPLKQLALHVAENFI